MWKWIPILILCIVSGCGTLGARRSSYPPEILEKIDRIVITNESMSNEFFDKVKELGIVQQKFNPLD